MAFDPDAYLAQKSGQQAMTPPSQEFNPDAYLAQKTGGDQSQSGIPGFMSRHPTIAGYTQGALNALPGAGMVAGGLVGGGGAGALTAGAGAPEGAALGAAGGAALGATAKDIGEAYLLGKQKSREDIYGDPLKAAGEGATAEMGGQVLGKGIEAAAQTPLGQQAVGLLGRGASKLGSELTGVPQQEIETYATNADKINEMAKSSDNNTALAADEMRTDWMNSVQAKRADLNGQISSALKDNEARVDGNQIVQTLAEKRFDVDHDLYPEQVQQMNNLIQQISKKIDDDGSMSIQDAQNVKRFLQDKASSAYSRPGDIFSIGTEAAKGARAAAATARGLVDEAAPEVANANATLAKLHDLEDSMNSNLLSEGKPEASILAAGSGGNQRNAMNLQKLGDITGTDMVGGAKNLATMRTFGNPSLLPLDTTGKASTRVGWGSALGGLIGHQMGIGFVPGVAAGAAATSPAVLKKAIDMGLLLKDGAGNVIIPATKMGLVNQEQKQP